MAFSQRTGARASGPRRKNEALCPGLPRPGREAAGAEPQQPCLGLDPSAAPFWAPTLPALPLDNVAFQGQTKASLKGENCVSMVEGRGWGAPAGRAQQRKPWCIYARLTQHNLIFHIKDQIIFRLQLITQPRSPSKAPPHPPSPCSVTPRAPRFHGLLLRVCTPAALPSQGPRGDDPETTGSVPISAHDAWSPHQNNSQKTVSQGSKPSRAPKPHLPALEVETGSKEGKGLT